MSERIHAKGLACPQPVLLTPKAFTVHDAVTILVDNETAVEKYQETCLERRMFSIPETLAGAGRIVKP